MIVPAPHACESDSTESATMHPHASPPPLAPDERTRYSVARFALDGPLLPLVTRTLPVAEALRRALMARDAAGRGPAAGPAAAPRLVSPLFSGKDAAGRPLRSHDHAHYLPSDEDGDGRLDHLTLWAPARFDSHELAALEGLRRLRLAAGEPASLRLIGLGGPADFRCPLFGPSAEWVSATPFLVSRHLKKRGRKRDPERYFTREGRPAFVSAVLHEELARQRVRRPDLAELPAPTVEWIADARRAGLLPFGPLDYHRQHAKPGDDGPGRPCGIFRLTFLRPVAGPLCLGHSSHFGLGLFRSV
jgi:CRISPR-associated protein Csb2